MSKQKSLTKLERSALTELLNLSDGHTRPDVASDVEARLITAYRQSDEKDQDQLEQEFLQTFFRSSGQMNCKTKNVYLTYSASSAIQAVATFCALNRKSVALIEPAFDNIPRTLQLMGVNLRAVSENRIHSFLNDEIEISEDVFWIVLPNNPTGFELDAEQFYTLVKKCACTGKLLVIDFCFRQYSSSMINFDQYKILNDSNCEYIAIEDTGKTWASQELKLGFLRLSEKKSKIHTFMDEYHDNLLLRVSPFVLDLLTSIINDGDGLKTSAKKFADNSKKIKEILPAEYFSMASDAVENWPLPMEWIRLRRPKFPLSATEFATLLQREYKVLVLPGAPFFWKNPRRGEDYIRISLARNDRIISHGSDRINDAVRKIIG